MSNINFLEQLESIKGEKISPENLEYLKKIAKTNRVLYLEELKAAEFSKPKYFFVNNQSKLVFLRNGKETLLCNIVPNHEFIAFKIENQKMVVFGYFPNDHD